MQLWRPCIRTHKKCSSNKKCLILLLNSRINTRACWKTTTARCFLKCFSQQHACFNLWCSDPNTIDYATYSWIFHFLSVVILLNPRFLISSTFLSISFSSLYSQPVLSQAENRFLNRQDSGDRAENHYWPRLGSIATTMASPDNRTDCHGYQIVNAHSRWKPLRPAFPFLKELCFKGKKIDIYSLFRRL